MLEFVLSFHFLFLGCNLLDSMCIVATLVCNFIELFQELYILNLEVF